MKQAIFAVVSLSEISSSVRLFCCHKTLIRRDDSRRHYYMIFAAVKIRESIIMPPTYYSGIADMVAHSYTISIFAVECDCLYSLTNFFAVTSDRYHQRPKSTLPKTALDYIFADSVGLT